MKTAIERIAETIISRKKLEDEESKERKRKHISIGLNTIRKAFEHRFESELPMLKEANIYYSAHAKGDYSYMGHYILFVRNNGRELRMDFESETSYRYEYTPSEDGNRILGKKVFGEWEKSDFILFLYNGPFV